MAASRRTPLVRELPHDMLVEIAARVAATSPHPMEDICSLRATCRATRGACEEGAVGSRVALEREERMRWLEHDRYLALVGNLAAAGNPEACFVRGLELVFAAAAAAAVRGGVEWLRRAATAGHKAAAYVLGVLHYGGGDKQEAERYIRQVEGEDEGEGGVAQGCEQQAGRKTNRECVRCRAVAVHAVREVTWKVVDGVTMGSVPVPVPPPGKSCKGSGCGVAEGWTFGCAVFCSDGCRIRHEYSEFFSRVPFPVDLLVANW